MSRLVRSLVTIPRWVFHGGVLLLLIWLFLPWPVALAWLDPDTTALMRERVRQSRAAGEALQIRHEPVPLSEMSPVLVRAVITAEDGRFRQHRGIDWEALGDELRYDGDPPFSWLDGSDRAALVRALRYGLTHRSEVRGRSTITQQLAKNLYFTPERSLLRKVGELFVAQRIEWLLSKDRILEVYLNSVELGPGIFGVEAAAQAYWGVSVSALTRLQAASLAATLPHPLTSNPASNPRRMLWRRDRVLQYMDGGVTTPIPPAPPSIPVPRLEPDTLPPSPDLDTIGGPR